MLSHKDKVMTTPELRIEKNRKSMFKDKIMALLPDGGNLNLCLTCGACSSGCPAAGIEGMDPRKFLRLASMGMDAEILSSQWAWCCTMCQRCIYACPMKIDIPQLIFNVRASWPRENRPKGIVASCDAALKHDTCSAMGVSEEDWHFVVEDVLEEVRGNQAGFEDLQAPMDKHGAEFFLNQNSREPVTEPEEMVPLWKILHLAGADWTYGSKGWAGENYCMFMAENQSWEQIVRIKAKAVEDLGCRVWLNTE
jgi:ferredoxin